MTIYLKRNWKVRFVCVLLDSRLAKSNSSPSLSCPTVLSFLGEGLNTYYVHDHIHVSLKDMNSPVVEPGFEVGGGGAQSQTSRYPHYTTTLGGRHAPPENWENLSLCVCIFLQSK